MKPIITGPRATASLAGDGEAIRRAARSTALAVLAGIAGLLGPARGADGADRDAPKAVSATPVIQLGHFGQVSSLAVSRDGQIALSGGTGGDLTLWHVPSGRMIRKLEGHGGDVRDIVLLNDGVTAFCGDRSGQAIFWNLAKGSVVRRISSAGRGGRSTVSRDGRTGLSSDGNTALVFDVDDGRVIRRLEGHQESINAVALTEDGKIGATGGDDGVGYLWDMRTGAVLKELRGEHVFRINHARFSPDSRSVLTAGDDWVTVWDVGPGKKSVCLRGDAQAKFLAADWSPDGKTILAGGVEGTQNEESALYRFDADTGLERWRTNDQIQTRTGDWFSAVASLPDGKGALVGGRDGVPYEVRVEDGEESKSFPKGTFPVATLGFSAGESALVVGTGRGRNVITLSARAAAGAAIAPVVIGPKKKINDYMYLMSKIRFDATGSRALLLSRGDTELWDLRGDKWLKQIPRTLDCAFSRDSGRFFNVSFEGDGEKLAVECYDAGSGSLIGTKSIPWKGGRDSSKSKAYLAESGTLTVLDLEGTGRADLTLYDLSTGVVTKRLGESLALPEVIDRANVGGRANVGVRSFDDVNKTLIVDYNAESFLFDFNSPAPAVPRPAATRFKGGCSACLPTGVTPSVRAREARSSATS